MAGQKRKGYLYPVFDAGASERCYRTWNGMHNRCYNESFMGYSLYGGRGIIICKRWKRNGRNPTPFMNFYEDMGNPPDDFSIDRGNPQRNYEPSNCSWQDKATQNNNRRKYGALETFTHKEISTYIHSLPAEQFLAFITNLLKKKR